VHIDPFAWNAITAGTRLLAEREMAGRQARLSEGGGGEAET
jgi:hypothetical protein